MSSSLTYYLSLQICFPEGHTGQVTDGHLRSRSVRRSNTVGSFHSHLLYPKHHVMLQCQYPLLLLLLLLLLLPLWWVAESQELLAQAALFGLRINLHLNFRRALNCHISWRWRFEGSGEDFAMVWAMTKSERESLKLPAYCSHCLTTVAQDFLQMTY